MVSVLNIEPKNINVTEKNNFKYNFLNNINHEFIISVRGEYYRLMNSIDNFKLKNIYHFIFLRLLKINKKFKEIPTIPFNRSRMSWEYLNKIIEEYIGDDIIKGIIIMNSIQLYFIPYY